MSICVIVHRILLKVVFSTHIARSSDISLLKINTEKNYTCYSFWIPGYSHKALLDYIIRIEGTESIERTNDALTFIKNIKNHISGEILKQTRFLFNQITGFFISISLEGINQYLRLLLWVGCNQLCLHCAVVLQGIPLLFMEGMIT